MPERGPRRGGGAPDLAHSLSPGDATATELVSALAGGTPLVVAHLAEREAGGFRAPPGLA